MTPKTVLSVLTVATLLGASFATVSYADGPRKGGDRMGMEQAFNFEAMDADKDGKVTQAEIQAFHAAKIAALDTNGDGNISAEELTAGREARKAERAAERSARMIESLDANDDGVLSIAELEARGGDRGEERMARMFDKVDTDDDGAISLAEAEAAKKMMHKRGKGKGHGHGDHDSRGN